MKNSDEMKKMIEDTKNYLLSIPKEELKELIENADDVFGQMLIESGFLEEEK